MRNPENPHSYFTVYIAPVCPPLNMPFFIRSPAKVNLCLDILGQDKSGYHEIQTVYQELPDLFDELEIEATDNPEIVVTSDHPGLPLDGSNTAVKAARLLKKHFAIKRGAKIFIRKRIPLMSGLGGGSSNAVAVMRALTELWGISSALSPVLNSTFSQAQTQAKSNPHPLPPAVHEMACPPSFGIMKLVTQIGMDCPFFLVGGTALGTHFGEKITPLPSLMPGASFGSAYSPRGMQIHVIDTGVKISSREAYGWVDISSCGKNMDKTSRLIEGLRVGSTQMILENIHNDFEPFIFKKHPELLRHKTASNIHLTGCGGSFFQV